MWYIERGGHLSTILSKGYYTAGEASDAGRRRFPNDIWTVIFIPSE